MRVAVLLLFGVGLFAQCPSALAPSSATVPARGASTGGTVLESFQVLASGGCRWTSQSQTAWISISFGQSGTNNGSVGYAVQQNLTPISRTGTIRVGEQTFTVIQAASSCGLSLSSTSASVPHTGGTGTFNVITTCQWAPTSNVDWIQVTGGGTGNGPVNFTVNPNPVPASRTGIISIYDRTFTITQAPSPCTISVVPPTDTIPALFSGARNLRVDAPPGCAWTVVNPASWVRVNPASGSGGQILSLSADNNPFAEERVARMAIGGASYTLTQSGAACSFSISPDTISVPPEGSSGSFNVGTTCDYGVQSEADWITVRSGPTGSGSSRVDYSVQENTTPESREGRIRVGTSYFNVSQTARPCTVTLDPESANFGSASNSSGTIRVTSTIACWSVESYSPWITITSVASTANGNGTITYAVASNPNSPSRTGTIQVGPKSFTVAQAGLGVFFTAESVAHAATAQGGPITPGELIVIYGVGMGPADLVSAQLTPDGTSITNSLAGTRVLFNGTPAPMIYTSSNQISAVVPYSVAGISLVEVTVEYNGLTSGPVSLSVVPTVPGIFSANKSGTGPGAILNQDYQYNSLIPAEKGSIIQIFGTGQGQTAPPSTDGRIASNDSLPQFVAPPSVIIDGVEAEVTYAGAAPGQVAGVFQINARIPRQARSGLLPILVRVGSALSRTGVTVSVR